MGSCRGRSATSSHPRAHTPRVKQFLIATALALFGFLYSWGTLLQDLGGRRFRSLVGLLSLGSMYVAFKYAPGNAADIVLAPGRELAGWFSNLFPHSLPHSPVPTTTVTTGP